MQRVKSVYKGADQTLTAAPALEKPDYKGLGCQNGWPSSRRTPVCEVGLFGFFFFAFSIFFFLKNSFINFLS